MLNRFSFTLLATGLLASQSFALSNSDFASLDSRSSGNQHYSTSAGKGFMPAWMLLGSNGGIIETNGVPAATDQSAFRFHTLSANFGDNKLDQCIPLDAGKDLSISFQVRTNVSPVSNDLRLRLNPHFYADMATCEKDLQSDVTTHRLTTGPLHNADRDVRLGSVSGIAANQWKTITAATHGTTGALTQSAGDIPAGTQAMRFSLRGRDDSASASRYIWVDDIRVTQTGSSTNLIRNGNFDHIDVNHSAYLVGSSGWRLDRDGDTSLRAGAGALPFARSGSNAFYFHHLTGNFGSSSLDQCVPVTGTSDLRPSVTAMSHSPHDQLGIRLNVDFYTSSNCGSGINNGLQVREDFALNNLPGEWRHLVTSQVRTAASLSSIQSAKISVRARDRSNNANTGPDGFQRTLYVDSLNLDATLSCAAPAEVGMYEVKAFLNPTVVLNGSQKLISNVRNEFDTGSSVRKFMVHFLDTDNLDLFDTGWSIRTRKREDQSTYRLQYKKRYSVGAGTLSSTLQTAYNQGIDACHGNEVEVDWGYNNRTLSFQRNNDLTLSFSGLNLPNLADTQTIATNNAIPLLVNWSAPNWGLDQIDDARLYGNVYFERYTGDFDGLELNIEIWHILNTAGTGYEYLVEASFKTANALTAAKKRADLFALLDNKGWLLTDSALKTETIMERY
ncbi:hypothetical protein [Cellvibrio japonicus]|nr:hypothetical protein [Cellvibrio japonicus]QEI12124.1 hypothetical protein FY117_07755 [Cellvibrio japonicus]QEI15698.1 hypothetical protein FY116_07760 [Cellvibrio japonicus]QEI19276.1 hypothetical protein FY115_07755 [Cellvibrio japonicus]